MSSTQDSPSQGLSDNLDPQALDILEHFAQIQRVYETVFLVLQVVGGHVLLPILVLTIILSKKVSRHPIFINFCTSWIISSVFYSLLVYRGRSSAEELSLNPSQEECLVQSALMNGAQALTSCTTLALIIHLILILRECLNKKPYKLMWFGPLTETYILLAFPLLAFIAFAAATTAVGNKPVVMDGVTVHNTTLAVPTVFYCVILQNADFATSLDPGFKFLRVVYSIMAAISIICFVFEVMVAIMVYRNRHEIRQKIAQGWVQMFLRVVLFSFYRMVAVSLNFAIIAQPDEILLTGLSRDNLYNGPIDFVQATIPLVAFLIFGTERQFVDSWRFWRWWRRPARPAQTVEDGSKNADQIPNQSSKTTSSTSLC